MFISSFKQQNINFCFDLNSLKYHYSYIRAIEITSTNEIENIAVNLSAANKYISSNKPLIIIENNKLSLDNLKTNIIDINLFIKLGKPLHYTKNTPEVYFSINHMPKLYLIIYSSENESIFLNSNNTIMYYSSFFNTNSSGINIVEFNKSFNIIDFKTIHDIHNIKQKLGSFEYVFSTIVFSLEIEDSKDNNKEIILLKDGLEGSTFILQIIYTDVEEYNIKEYSYFYEIKHFKLNYWNFIDIKFIKIKEMKFKFKLNVDNNAYSFIDVENIFNKFLIFNLNIILYDYEKVNFANSDVNNLYKTYKLNSYNGVLYNTFNNNKNNNIHNIITNKYRDFNFKSATDSNGFYYFKEYHKNKIINFYYPVEFDTLHYNCNEVEIDLFINNILGFSKIDIAYDNYMILPVQRNILDDRFINIDQNNKSLSAKFSIKRDFIDKYINNDNVIFVLITIHLDSLDKINNINQNYKDLHTQYGYFVITLTSLPNYIIPLYNNNNIHSLYVIDTYLSSQSYLKMNIDTNNLFRIYLTFEINDFDYDEENNDYSIEVVTTKYSKKHSLVNYNYNFIDINNSNTPGNKNTNSYDIYQIILVQKRLESTIHKISSFVKGLEVPMFNLFLKLTRDSSDKSNFRNKNNILAKMVSVKLLFVQNFVFNISLLDYYNSNCFEKGKSLQLSNNNNNNNNSIDGSLLKKTDIFNREININYQAKGEFYIIITKDKEIEDNNYAFFLNNRSVSNSFNYNKFSNKRSDYDTIGVLEVYFTNQYNLLNIISKNLKPGINIYDNNDIITTNGVNIDLRKDNNNLSLRNKLNNYIINSKSIYIPLKDIMKLNVDNKRNKSYNKLFFNYLSIEEDIYSAYICKIIDNTSDVLNTINTSESYVFDFKSNGYNLINTKINNNESNNYVLIIDIIFIKQILDNTNLSYNLKISYSNNNYDYNVIIDDINSNNYYNKYYNKEIKKPIYRNDITHMKLELSKIKQSIYNFDKDKYFHDIDSNIIVKLIIIRNNNKTKDKYIPLNNLNDKNMELDFEKTYYYLIESKSKKSSDYYNENLPDEILNIKISASNLFKTFSYYILVNPIDIDNLNEVPDNVHSFTDNGLISLQDIGIFKVLRQRRYKSIISKQISNEKEEYINNSIYIVFKLNSNKDMFIGNNDYKFGIKTVDKATMSVSKDTYLFYYDFIDEYNNVKKISFNNNSLRYSLVRNNTYSNNLIVYFYFYNINLEDLDSLLIKVFDKIILVSYYDNDIINKKYVLIKMDDLFYNKTIRLFVKSLKSVNIFMSTIFLNNEEYIESLYKCNNSLKAPIIKNDNKIDTFNFTALYNISWKSYCNDSKYADKFKQRILYFVFIDDNLIELDKLLDSNIYKLKSKPDNILYRIVLDSYSIEYYSEFSTNKYVQIVAYDKIYNFKHLYEYSYIEVCKIMNDGQFYITDNNNYNIQDKFCFKLIESEYIISLKYTELYIAKIYVNKTLYKTFTNNNNIVQDDSSKIFTDNYIIIKKEEVIKSINLKQKLIIDNNNNNNKNNNNNQSNNEYNILILVYYNNKDIFEYNKLPLKDYVLNNNLNNKEKVNNLFNTMNQISIWISSVKSKLLIDNYNYKTVVLYALKDSIHKNLNTKTNEINSKVSNILIDKKTVDEIIIYFDYYRDKDSRNSLNLCCIKNDIYQNFNYKIYESKDSTDSKTYDDYEKLNFDLIEEFYYIDCTNNILIDFYKFSSNYSSNDKKDSYNYLNLNIKKTYKLVLSTNDFSVEFLLTINNYLNYNKIFEPDDILKNLNQNTYKINSVIPISNILDNKNYYYNTIYIDKLDNNLFLYSDDIRSYKALFISDSQIKTKDSFKEFNYTLKKFINDEVLTRYDVNNKNDNFKIQNIKENESGYILIYTKLDFKENFKQGVFPYFYIGNTINVYDKYNSSINKDKFLFNNIHYVKLKFNNILSNIPFYFKFDNIDNKLYSNVNNKTNNIRSKTEDYAISNLYNSNYKNILIFVKKNEFVHFDVFNERVVNYDSNSYLINTADSNQYYFKCTDLPRNICQVNKILYVTILVNYNNIIEQLKYYSVFLNNKFYGSFSFLKNNLNVRYNLNCNNIINNYLRIHYDYNNNDFTEKQKKLINNNKSKNNISCLFNKNAVFSYNLNIISKENYFDLLGLKLLNNFINQYLSKNMLYNKINKDKKYYLLYLNYDYNFFDKTKYNLYKILLQDNWTINDSYKFNIITNNYPLLVNEDDIESITIKRSLIYIGDNLQNHINIISNYIFSSNIMMFVFNLSEIDKYDFDSNYNLFNMLDTNNAKCIEFNKTKNDIILTFVLNTKFVSLNNLDKQDIAENNNDIIKIKITVYSKNNNNNSDKMYLDYYIDNSNLVNHSNLVAIEINYNTDKICFELISNKIKFSFVYISIIRKEKFNLANNNLNYDDNNYLLANLCNKLSNETLKNIRYNNYLIDYIANKSPQFCTYNSLLFIINKDNINNYIYNINKENIERHFKFEKVLKLPFYKNIKAYDNLNKEYVNIMIFKINISLNILYNKLANINNYIESFGIGYSTIKNIKYYNTTNSETFTYRNISNQNAINTKEYTDNNFNQEFIIEIAFPDNAIQYVVDYECFLHIIIEIELKEEFIYYLNSVKDNVIQNEHNIEFYIDALINYKLKEYYPAFDSITSNPNKLLYDLRVKEKEYIYMNPNIYSYKTLKFPFNSKSEEILIYINSNIQEFKLYIKLCSFDYKKNKILENVNNDYNVKTYTKGIHSYSLDIFKKIIIEYLYNNIYTNDIDNSLFYFEIYIFFDSKLQDTFNINNKINNLNVTKISYNYKYTTSVIIPNKNTILNKPNLISNLYYNSNTKEIKFLYKNFNTLINNQINADFYLLHEEIKYENKNDLYNPLINIELFEAFKDFRIYYSTKSKYINNKNSMSLIIDNQKFILFELSMDDNYTNNAISMSKNVITLDVGKIYKQCLFVIDTYSNYNYVLKCKIIKTNYEYVVTNYYYNYKLLTLFITILALLPFWLILYGIAIICIKLITIKNENRESLEKSDTSVSPKTKKSCSFNNSLEDFSLYDK